jgi:hypothetical protein
MTRIRRNRQRWTLGASILVLGAALLAGNVIAGQFRTEDPAAFRADIASGELVRVASVEGFDGQPGSGVFAQVTDDGRFCLWDAPSARSRARRGGCNTAEDPLGGSPLSASLAYEGGPGVENVQDARLIGLVSAAVARVAVLMSDGTERMVHLAPASVGQEDFFAFGYRIRASDLRRGIGPTAVIARDADGVEIARQPTGIAG